MCPLRIVYSVKKIAGKVSIVNGSLTVKLTIFAKCFHPVMQSIKIFALPAFLDKNTVAPKRVYSFKK